MDKTIKNKKGKHFYGTTSIGAKGQVVIPVEARNMMNLKKGEKLLAFGMGRDMLVLTKLSKIEQFASHLSSKLKEIRGIIKETK